MFGKRLINTGGIVCPSDNTDLFEDGSGVALYRLNSNAADSSGNHNGTATDVTYVSGHIDNAASFNGSSSYVTNSTLFSGITNQITISAWLKKDGIGTVSLLNNYTGAQTNFIDFQLMHPNGNYYINYGNESSRMTGTVPSTWYDNTWHHFALVKSTTTLTLYVDGVSFHTQSDSSSITSGAFANIGKQNTIFSTGQIDQVRLFDRDITAEEVTTLYNEVAC